MRDYVDSQAGEVVQEFFDSVPGTEGRYEERKGLHEALGLLHSQRADTLVVYDISRAARDDAVFSRLLNDVYETQGRLAVAVERQVYKSKSEAEMLLHWTKAASVYEVITLKRRTQAGKLKAFEEGSYLWKPIRGYKVSRKDKLKVLDIDEPIASVIRECLERLATGESKAAVANFAQSLGFHWNTNNINKLIDDSHLYAGGSRELSTTLHGVVYTREYAFPPFISTELSETVKRLPRKAYRHDTKPTQYSGVMKCSCGYNVAVMGRFKEQTQLTCGTYYRAKRRRQRGVQEPGVSHSRSVSDRVVTLQVLKFLANEHEGYNSIPFWFDGAVADSEMRTADIRKALTSLNTEIEGLVNRITTFEESKNVVAVLDKKLGALLTKQAELEKELGEEESAHKALRTEAARVRSIDHKATREAAFTAIVDDDWHTANRLLGDLGIVIEADFSQPNVRDSISVGLRHPK